MHDPHPNQSTHPTQTDLPSDGDSRQQQRGPTLEEIVAWVDSVGGRWASPEDLAQI